MSEIDVVKRLFELIESHDTASAAKLLSEDFTFSGPVPEPLGGAEWLAMHDTLAVAFPDWSFNLGDVEQENGMVCCTAEITGTHRGELDLTSLGFSKIPATGKSVRLPREDAELKVEGERIKYFKSSSSEKSGVMGILSQLGVEMPEKPSS